MSQATHPAAQTLKAAGVPVMSSRWSRGLFEINAEECGDAPNGLPWADYYLDAAMPFGVNPALEAMLKTSGLYCEWVNPGVLAVYEA